MLSYIFKEIGESPGPGLALFISFFILQKPNRVVLYGM